MKCMEPYRLVRAGFLNESDRNLPKMSADGRESGTATPIFALFPAHVQYPATEGWPFGRGKIFALLVSKWEKRERGTFSKWQHSGVSWWTVRVVCTKLASEMQSIKCFSARWLGNTRRAPAPGAQSKTVHSKYRQVRKCLASHTSFISNPGNT